MVIDIDPAPSHASQPSSPAAAASPDHVAVSMPASPVAASAPAHPSFLEALGARIQGAIPAQLTHAATDLVCSAIEAAALGSGAGAGALQSLVQTGLSIGLETVGHLGITAITQTESAQSLADRIAGEPMSKEEALRRMRAFSALLSAADAPLLNLGMSQAAAAILQQSLTPAEMGLTLLNGFIGAGVLTGGAMVLYHTNESFRSEVDLHLQSLLKMVGMHQPAAAPPQDPPSFAQADAMELGHAGMPPPPAAIAP